MLIAQITDLHIRPPGKKAYGVVDTEAMLRAAVDSILAQPMKPDAVIASGDLTDCGLIEEYELLHDCLKPWRCRSISSPATTTGARTCGWCSAATATCR